MGSYPRIGGSVGGQRAVDDLSRAIAGLRHMQAALADAVSGFTAAPIAGGALVTWTLALSVGLSAITLLRGTRPDQTAATVLNTLAGPAPRQMSFADLDPAIAGQDVYYWLELTPINPDLSPATFGPVTLAAAAGDGAAPDALLDFDASAGAGGGGAIPIGAAFMPPPESRWAAAKIYISGYRGSMDWAAVAEGEASPLAFTLEETGETVTLHALSVNGAGIEAARATALAKALTLNGTATVPAKIMNLAASAASTGVQISFPAGPESTISSYLIYRGPLFGGPANAAQIGTVAPAGAEAAYTFLDTAGLSGVYEWYVRAENAAGLSAWSEAVTTDQIWTSANLPPNCPANQTNYAMVDSIDAGSSATVRIYGTGGVGTSWTRQTGFGTQTYPYGTIAGLAYSTTYYVMWNGSAYVAETAFPSTLPDHWVWAGKVVTVAAGGGGGTSGGGGATGGGRGFIYPT